MRGLKKKAEQVYQRFRKVYPDARIELNFSSPLELLVATILSAQCTDTRVNEVTARLFEKYKTPEDYISRPVSESSMAVIPVKQKNPRVIRAR